MSKEKKEKCQVRRLYIYYGDTAVDVRTKAGGNQKSPST